MASKSLATLIHVLYTGPSSSSTSKRLVFRRMGLVEIILLLLLTLRFMASTGGFSLPPNCPKSCGNISIEWPFGIGNDCFHPGFNLTCTNHTTNPTRLLLGDGTTEVSKIDMEKGLVHVRTQILTMGVGRESISTSLIDLRNWPYSSNLITEYIPNYFEYLAYNRLHVAGCSAIANLVDLTTNYTIDTCTTICSATSQHQHQYSFGDGYCTLHVAWDLANTTSLGIQLIRLDETDLHLVNASDIKAFIYDAENILTEDLEEIVKGRNRTILTATLAWYINDYTTCKEAQNNTNTYACRSLNSDCYNAFPYSDFLNYTIGYFCRCPLGYQGNPYIPNGCQDKSFTASPAKDCETQCGNINVFFPFGLKEGCYRDPLFALTCNKTYNPPTLLWNYAGINVSNISMEEGTLELEQNYDLLFYSMDETKALNFNEKETVVSWAIENQPCDDAKKNMTRFACVDNNSICLDTTTTSHGRDILGYRCRCSDGYEGNPYLHDGCTDIDECKFPKKYSCEGSCVNMNGSYICCAQGTHGDPKSGACIPNKNDKNNIVLGVIIGASVGLGLLFLSIIFAILYRKWKKKKEKKIREQYFRQNHGLLLQQLIYSSNEDVEKTKIFCLKEIEKATNNFDETRVLGHGGHGTVYKGILSDQRIVAIKRSKIVKKSEIEQFINEVAILSQINHRNVVKLFGCCLETEVPLLIYEFISNGTLSDHLHIPDGKSTLSWEDRIRIAAEAAEALTYLHSAASISIFHRDVKSSNILLDDQLTAKLSDFGASRFIPLDQTHIVTAAQGTFGYLDPEYYQTYELTEKSDVYSFGVILLELLTGKKPIFSIEHEKPLNLPMHFLQALRDNCCFDLLEDCVRKEGNEEELVEIIQLIEMCLKDKGVERPTMKEVEYRLQTLKRIRNRKKGHYIAEDNDETEYLLNNSSYSFSKSIDQVSYSTTENYSLEKESIWSQYHPR